MWRMIKIEFERAFRNKYFYAALAIGMIISGLHIVKYVIPDAWFIRNYNGGMEKLFVSRQMPNLYMDYIEIYGGEYHTLFHFILPILVAMPYAMTIYTDYKNKYMNQMIIRSGKRNYHFAKLLTQFVVGGCVAVIPMIVSFIVTAMLLPAVKPELMSPTYKIYGASLFGELFYCYPMIYVFVLWVINFIGFGLVGTLSFVFAEYMENRFMTVFVPFILYFCQDVTSAAVGKCSVKIFLQLPDVRREWIGDVLPFGIVIMILICIALVNKIGRKDLIS